MRTPFWSNCGALTGVAVAIIAVALLVEVGSASVAVGSVSAMVGFATTVAFWASWVGRLPQVQAISTSRKIGSAQRYNLLQFISDVLYANSPGRITRAAVAECPRVSRP